MPKILIVEDNETLALTMSSVLALEHHVVDIVLEGTEGLERILFYPYDVVILDWDLPGVSGIEICRQYRAQGGLSPILMLTGKSLIQEKERGLDSGADDYLTKPFDLKEMCARVRALMRRSPQFKSDTFTFDGLSVDMANGLVSRNGKPIHLIPKEIALLTFLIRHKDQAFSAEALVDRVWSSESEVSAESVRPHVNRLRAKIDAPGRPSLIKTLRGRGYMLSLNDDIT